MIHVWVDPRYGCDEDGFLIGPALGAPAMNPNLNPPCAAPNCGGPSCPGGTYTPADVLDASSNVLLHASWPFRTVTQAIAYIPPLPYTSSTGHVWKYAIIHCLPGVYARSMPPDVRLRDNGLPYNGETFPIRLPPGVSIQGTSALNTVFFLGDPEDLSAVSGKGPAFSFGDGMVTGQVDRTTFIDSVAIYGAIPFVTPPSADQLAAIYVGHQAKATPTISNCFLFRNVIGVLVAADHDNPAIAHDGLALVNNTFAFNGVGLWSGQLPYQSTGQQVTVSGVSKLILINNIFDAGLPESGQAYPRCRYAESWFPSRGPYLGTGKDFEGVSWNDMTVGSPGPQENFNAFEWWADQNPQGRYNTQQPIPLATGLLDKTSPRNTTQPLVPAPSRNIARYTGWSLNQAFTGQDRRGVLYLRDLFCRLGQALPCQTPPCDIPSDRFDLSPMDFRLAPAVALADQNTPQTPSRLNPLVDNGWGSSVAGAFPVTMANGESLAAPPGTLPVASWPYDSWQHDAEGFGNPRMHNHVMYAIQVEPPPPGNQYVGVIDIGADELADTIVGGYLYGTTGFMSFIDDPQVATKYPVMLPPPFKPPDNKYLWYFGPPASLVIGSPDPDPPWFREVQNQGTSPPAYQFKPVPWFDVWKFDPPVCQGYYTEPTKVDITPHLRLDPHPWWQFALSIPSNPIWQHCIGGYNSYLYMHPDYGVIHPPGTFAGNAFFQWLDLQNFQGLPQTTVVPFLPYDGNAPLQLTGFDPWCRGEDTASSPPRTNRYDVFLETYQATDADITALRFSVETEGRGTWGPTLAATNAQSFMVVVEGAGQ